MRAMILRQPGNALEACKLPMPVPRPGELLIRVATCAVCRTDLHIVDGELPGPKLPLVLGLQIVGRVEKTEAKGFSAGDRVGIPWLGWTGGECVYCRSVN